MRRLLLIFLLGAGSALGAPTTEPAPGSVTRSVAGADQPVFATVNGVDLPHQLFDFLLNSRADSQGGADDDAQFDERLHREQATKDLIMTELLSQQAVEHGMHQSELFRTEMAMAEKTLLAQLYVQSLIRNIQIDEAHIQARYREQPEQTLYRFMIWRTRDESEAHYMLSALQARADTSAQPSEGSLPTIETPWLRGVDIEPDVERLVSQLQPLEFVGRPILQDGVWKVVQVIDRQVLPRSSYEEEREVILAELQQQQLEQIYEKLTRESSIVFQ